jgi:hypothetical protein
MLPAYPPLRVFSIYEKHVCFSVLKENRSANTDLSSGIGEVSSEAVRDRHHP